MIRRVTRVAMFAAAICCALTGASQAQPCGKTDDVRIMIFAALFNNMVTYVAQDAGFFKKHCMNAALVPVNTGSAGMAQLQSGSLHFSDSSFDNTLIARNKGLPIKVVVGESTGVPYSLVARKGLPMSNAKAGYPHAMKDLVGKRIGVFGIGTGSEYFVRALMRGAGLDPGSVTYVAVGSTPTQLAALENGAIDAVIMADPAQDLAVKGGSGEILVDLRKPGSGPPDVAALSGAFQVKVAAESLIAQNPGLVSRYVRANSEAADWIRDPANFPELLRLMKARVSLGKEIPDADALFSDLVKQYAGFSAVAISRKSVAAWNQFEIAAGNIKEPISFDDVIWSEAPKGD